MRSGTDALAAPASELELLRSALADPGVLTMLDGLEADLSVPSHRVVLRAMRHLAASSSQAMDLLTIRQTLASQGALEQVPERALLDIFGDVPTGARLDHHVALVRERAARRRLVERAKRLIAQATDPSAEVGALVQGAELALEDLHGATVRAETPTYDQRALITMGLQAWTERTEARGAGRQVGVRLGLGELDDAIGALAPGSLVVIGARPSAGKSALCLRIVATAARSAMRAEILSLEDPPETWAIRELARSADASATNLRLGGSLGESELSRIGAAARDAHDLWRVADCRSARGLATIVAHMRRSAVRHRPRVFVLDYIQLVRVRGARERRHEIERAVATLKSAAAELGAVMVIASQLRRHDGHPTLELLKEAGAIEEAAELVLLLHRVRDTEAGDRVYAEIAKHKDGADGHVSDVYEIGWDPRSATFLESRLIGPWWRVPGVQRRPRRAG